MIATGASITLSLQITLNEPVPVGATVELKIKKEGFIIDLPLPCLEIGGLHIGSWWVEQSIISLLLIHWYIPSTYEVDHLLELGAGILCPTHVPEGQECHLPLNPGVYGGGDPLIIGPLEDIPAIIEDHLASGIFDVEATLKTVEGDIMACIFLRAELTGHSSLL